MNDRQRKILIIVAALIGIMIIYPPFQMRGHGLGYSWIFSPPIEDATINVSQLLVQWIAVVIIGGIAFILSKKSQSIQTSMQENTASVSSLEEEIKNNNSSSVVNLSYKYTVRVVIVLLVAWVVGCILTKTDPTKIYLVFSYPSYIFGITMRGLGGLSVPFVMVGSVLYIYGKRQKKPHSFYNYLVWTTVFALIILLKS